MSNPTSDEKWKAIPSFEGYEASSLGRIRWRTRIKKPSTDSQGYQRVSFWTDRGSRKTSVHSLVAEAFLGPRPEGLVIRHINGDCADNRPENLVYGTQVENEADKKSHGKHVEGERHPASKLTDEMVAEIRRRHKAAPKEFNASATAREFGVTWAVIKCVIDRVTWKHVN